MTGDQLRFEVSHPFAKYAKGWGTQGLRGSRAELLLLAIALTAAAGCGHRQSAARLPVPQAAPPSGQAQAYPAAPAPPARIAPTPAPPGGVSSEDLNYVRTHKPILTEEGLATWYTAPRSEERRVGK